MKNKKQPKNRHELKQNREFRNIVLTIISFAIVACVAYVVCLNHTPTDTTNDRPDIVNYINSHLTQDDVYPGYFPALIYYTTQETGASGFLCTGTIFNTASNGVEIITAEHIFRNDIMGHHTFEVRPLRGSIDVPICYMKDIVATSSNLSGLDAVVATLDTNPVVLGQFSDYVYREMGQNFYAPVVVHDRPLPTLRSLVTGVTSQTIGYVRRGEEGTSNGAIFILIEYHAYHGESGTGFVDQYGGLWVLHAGPEDGAEQDMCDEYHRITGKSIKAIASVSGPFGGKYTAK